MRREGRAKRSSALTPRHTLRARVWPGVGPAAGGEPADGRRAGGQCPVEAFAHPSPRAWHMHMHMHTYTRARTDVMSHRRAARGGDLAAVLVEEPLAQRLGEGVGVRILAQPGGRPLHDGFDREPRDLRQHVVAVEGNIRQLLRHARAAREVAVDVGGRHVHVGEEVRALLRQLQHALRTAAVCVHCAVQPLVEVDVGSACAQRECRF